ncbi:putative protein kinase RLK-Pelle-LRR-I-1 family [Helianthus annuus]|uniref:non-specific serine/threonine protein kinase n=1 Tax=Helianthus annuus TaxID=4232 RepID=A0A251V4X5_HELAN|nr:putative protein kinase RLK-Pelle-LRR-I-1 family [Helianthus annuus]KAJ0606622.1 putative protein kinase RLK-Pelle-LRR-I-1 family [Helianthus annuus]KAJ0933956.1 putative protein kinase RLK-Pelle-LRR-I-1 family [Helianthus annuus]
MHGLQHFLFQVPFEHLRIPLNVILLATNNFDEKYLLGSGGYGEVYKAELNDFNIKSSLATKLKSEDGHPKLPNTVAIKRIFHREDSQGKEGFLAELEVLSKCEHRNIVSLLGFCVEGSEMLLVYEHVSNGSLDDYLGSIDKMVNLTWTQRLKICIEIAEGLNYLHTTMEDKKRIIHRDIKSDNILLGENWEAKIADFGLSKIQLNQHDSTINTNHIAGTNVYLDPEYAKTCKLKIVSDIYSFGVVLFEIFSGKLAYDSNFMKENEKGLAPVIRRHFKKGTLKEMLDPEILENAFELGFTGKVGPDHDSLKEFLKIAYPCIAKIQAHRPQTTEVVIKGLKSSLAFQVSQFNIIQFCLPLGL